MMNGDSATLLNKNRKLEIIYLVVAALLITIAGAVV